MPNVHVDAGPAGSPTPEGVVRRNRKDGVLIDGRGSYSIDQQRYNGQFGGNAFWEIKSSKKTRMVTNITYDAISVNLGKPDAISGQRIVGDARNGRRCEGSADADQQHLAWLALPAHSEDPASARPTRNKKC